MLGRWLAGKKDEKETEPSQETEEKLIVPSEEQIRRQRYGEIGEDVYNLSIPHFLEICHDVEKSIYREMAFYKLLQFKKGADAEIFAGEVYDFLQEAAAGHDLETDVPTISPSEAALVTMGIDDWYEQYKIGAMEKHLTAILEQEWSALHRELPDIEPDLYVRLRAVSGSHVIGNQPITVVEYASNSASEEMLSYLVLTQGGKYHFTAEESIYYSQIPSTEISREDCGLTFQSLEFGSDEVIFPDAADSYVYFPAPVYDKDIALDVREGYGYRAASAYYVRQARRILIHNNEVSMRENNLASYIDNERSYQTRFLQLEDFSGDEDAAFHLMRCYKSENIAAEILAAYLRGNTLQLTKISPSLLAVIQKFCPSFNKNGLPLRLKLGEYNAFENIIATHLPGFAPSFEAQMKEFYRRRQKKAQADAAINGSITANSLKDYVQIARGILQPVSRINASTADEIKNAAKP